MTATNLNLAGYHLTFDDEFNAFSWSPTGSPTQWATTAFWLRTLSANGEQEYYSDTTVGKNPFTLQNGVLTITAAPGSNALGLPYNSGEITTAAMFSQSTGYFEIRAQLPSGAGMWPAFWLMPENPVAGEIDAMEAFGSPAPDGEGGATTYHWGMHAPNAAQNGGAWVPAGANITAGYHTYGVDVELATTTYYFDRKEVAQIATPAGLGNQPLYMIANLAVGGSWPGDATGESGQMKIDYIRAYSKDPKVPTVAAQPVPTPGDPVITLPAPSAKNTVVTAASGKTIVDASGNHWVIANGIVVENGAAAAYTANVLELAYVGGAIWHENTSSEWYRWSSGNWTGATTTAPVPVTPSANDTIVKTGTAAAVTDAGGNKWTIVGGIVQEDGANAGYAPNALEIAYVNGNVWYENTNKLWSEWSNGSWGATAKSTSPLPTNAATPSPNNTMVLAGSGHSIIDASRNVWTIVNGVVRENGTAAAYTANVAEMAYVNGALWHENTSGTWYRWTGTDWAGDHPTSPLPAPMTIAATTASITITQSQISVAATSGDHMLFVKGSGDVITLSGGTDTVSDTGSGNTYILPAPGHGKVLFDSHVLSNGDQFDLQRALAATGWDHTASNLTKVLTVTDTAQGATIALLPAGGATSTVVASISGATTLNLAGLMAHAFT